MMSIGEEFSRPVLLVHFPTEKYNNKHTVKHAIELYKNSGIDDIDDAAFFLSEKLSRQPLYIMREIIKAYRTGYIS